MKNISLSFSEFDIKTILFTLSILPSLKLEKSEAQADINYQCCLSAAEKLANHRTDILPNELRVISASLQSAQMINQGILEGVDKKIRKKCGDYMFSINQLSSKLEKLL